MDVIRTALAECMNERNCRALLCVESGSRAWGFESSDSDWDPRFIYVRPAGCYLSPWAWRDTIEWREERDGRVLDFAGWDLMKALRLLVKPNATLHEWIASPVRYQQDEEFMLRLNELAKMSARRAPMVAHYYNMSRQHWRRYVAPTLGSVRLKQYLYALRADLCVLWLWPRVEGSIPPVRFAQLRDEVGPEVGVYPDHQKALDDLLARKTAAGEDGMTPRSALLDGLHEGAMRIGESITQESPRRKVDQQVCLRAEILALRVILEERPL